MKPSRLALPLAVVSGLAVGGTLAAQAGSRSPAQGAAQPAGPAPIHPPGPADAPPISLDKLGGAAPGTTTLELATAPASPYLILLSPFEQPTQVLGLRLAIPLQFASASLALPGFVGVTGPTGAASASLFLPGDPVVLGMVLSFQAIGGAGPFAASNLVRVTPATPGTFEPALSSPPVPVLSGGAVPGPDATVLLVGGSGPLAQRYHSRTEEWSPGGLSFGVGLLSQTTRLADGRVLFTGGIDATGQPTAAAAVFDPVSGQTATLAMQFPRAGHGASLLGNGVVLITGGFSTFDLSDPLVFLQGIQGTTELFDPGTGTFAAGPALLEPRALHSSTTLPNGQAVIAGGITLVPIVNIPLVSSTAYRFNPATGSFGFPAFFSGARFLHSAEALPNGRVLLAGGLTLDLTQFLATGDPTTITVGTRTDVQVYTANLFGGTFATVNALSTGRAGAGIAVLPDGGALIAGGFELAINFTTMTFAAQAVASADRFTPVGSSGTLAPTGSMAEPRLLPLAIPLPDRTVLVVGGGPLTAEIYQP